MMGRSKGGITTIIIIITITITAISHPRGSAQLVARRTLYVVLLFAVQEAVARSGSTDRGDNYESGEGGAGHKQHS